MDGWNSVNGRPSSISASDSILHSGARLGDDYSDFFISPLGQPSSRALQTTSQHDLSPNPLRRFEQQAAGPWFPPGIVDVSNSQAAALPKHSNSFNLRTGYNGHNASFVQYQNKASSELESDVTGQHDSGYGTRSQATASILSSDVIDHNQERTNVSGRIDNDRVL